jgi:hypothetical protein
MECLDSIDLSALIIWVTREGVDESIDLPNFWHIVDMKIPLIRRRTNEYSSILQEKTPHTMLAHGTISDIAVAYVHGKLWEYPIAYRECHFLVAYEKPRMLPEIVVV